MRCMVEKGLSERRALTVVRISASALRYEPRPDLNVELREQIAALAHRRRRYGVGMILSEAAAERTCSELQASGALVSGSGPAGASLNA